MEDIRTYRDEEEENWHIPDEERDYASASKRDDEVPFHIPRD